MWFQEISLPPPWRDWKFQRGRGVKSQGDSRGVGVDGPINFQLVQFSVWFSTNPVIIRKFTTYRLWWNVLKFERSLQRVYKGLRMVCKGFINRITLTTFYTISTWPVKTKVISSKFWVFANIPKKILNVRLYTSLVVCERNFWSEWKCSKAAFRNCEFFLLESFIECKVFIHRTFLLPPK